METASRPSKISRIDLRFRHLAQDVKGGVSDRDAVVAEKEEEVEGTRTDEPLLIREQKGRPVMGNAHRKFHRRAAEPSRVLTVMVDVIATVDANSQVIPLQTVTPALPAVPDMPTVAIPSVPAVPPFPSDLTVPAYPYPTAISETTSQTSISSSATDNTSAASTNATPSPSASFNSTISSSRSSTSTSISLSTSSLTSSLLSSSSSRSSSISTSVSTSSTSTSSPLSSTIPTSASSFTGTAWASTVYGGGGGGGPASTAPADGEPTAAASDTDSGSGSTPTPTVVGSVVGSIAGFALILAILLFLLRRHKRKQRGGALQLSGNDAADNQPIASSGQQMATRSNALPAAFLNRFSSTSKSTADTSTTGERGFQRISGRKLPSAFSEGMTSEQFARGEGTLSGSSFYTDDQGFYGGPGGAAAAAAAATNKEFGKEIGETGGNSGAVGTKERIMPSPARTPVVHHAGDAPPWGASRNGGGSTLSPPQSPNPSVPPRGTLGRSHPSHDGSRGSRFTEDV